MINIGINGFGRIGRTLARLCVRQPEKFRLVAVNDIIPDRENLAYLFKYDSTYGRYSGDVKVTDNGLSIDGTDVVFSAFQELTSKIWTDNQVDIVIDSSGIESNVAAACDMAQSTENLKTIVTHSSDKVDREVIMGVNDQDISPTDRVISASICDANACAHPLNWLAQEYGIVSGSLTTLHPWLSYQNLVDGASLSQRDPGFVWKDYSLGRASSSNLIPKNTTAVSATEKVLPALRGKLMSFSYRIPTNIVTSSDMVLQLEGSPGHRDVEELLLARIGESLYVTANHDPLVSIDYECNDSSAIIDMQWFKVHNGLTKIVLWYDNEWGYSNRVLDLALTISKAG